MRPGIGVALTLVVGVLGLSGHSLVHGQAPAPPTPGHGPSPLRTGDVVDLRDLPSDGVYLVIAKPRPGAPAPTSTARTPAAAPRPTGFRVGPNEEILLVRIASTWRCPNPPVCEPCFPPNPPAACVTPRSPAWSADLTAAADTQRWWTEHYKVIGTLGLH